ncbi:MAG TPA: His/Gly/Thr/Pro-type tRNA ligase C-terminal domain-containing protein [Candidatus Magasanikbacteria bacterium]|nr:His/Gly/Thr/Pro-type tRNA ligase C-terminal domain-containing protein [Candidatus Magasanikbacteria bacterium]
MRQSQLFTKTRKEAPGDEVSKNAQLLIRAGFIHKEMAGVYSLLPLGLKVLKKIEQIIREEMDSIGGQEVSLAALQEKTNWEKTARWSDEVVDNWFKTKLKNDTELGLAFTHEEPLTALMTSFIASYKDLPCSAYQFQTKFRNELRSKSGIMRGREFVMKDLYSFSKTQEEHDAFYEQVKESYNRIFARVGIGEKTYVTFASGGSFSKYSHEFQTLTDAGEDEIYVDDKKKLAINKEVYTDEVLTDLNLTKADLKVEKAVEVGNIFSLGTKFSEPLSLSFAGEDGKSHSVIMGSYGIGLGRLMGTVVELCNDEKGILWPESIAPYQIHLVSLCREPADVQTCNDIYAALVKKGVEVLYDDREARAGEKFADSDLIGIPVRVVVSPKTLANKSVEYKKRGEADATILTIDELISK